MAKKRLGFPHYMEVVKLTMVFSVLLAIFGISFAYMSGMGRLGFADAKRQQNNYMNKNVVCAEVYQPVCGVNGVTYSNECAAVYQAGVQVECSGECPCGDNDPFENPILYQINN